MTKVILDMAISLDGLISSDNEYQLYGWYFDPDGANADVVQAMIDMTGAILIGRHAYDLGDSMDGYVDNPYQVPNFVVTHHVPERPAKGTTQFVFVTDGIESALQQAKAAAGDKSVVIGGGADIAQQYLNVGLIDELHLHLEPVLIGAGLRLFDHLAANAIALERIELIEKPTVTHLKFRVVKSQGG